MWDTINVFHTDKVANFSCKVTTEPKYPKYLVSLQESNLNKYKIFTYRYFLTLYLKVPETCAAEGK